MIKSKRVRTRNDQTNFSLAMVNVPFLLHTVATIITNIYFNYQKQEFIQKLTLDYSIVVVYMTCKANPKANVTFDPKRFGLKTINIKCNPQTRDFECREAIPMLDFIIDNYGNYPAQKIFFIHGHERSGHYWTSVYNVIRKVIKMDYFRNDRFGGIYKAVFHPYSMWAPNTTKKEHNREIRKIFPYVYKNTSMWHYYNLNETSFPCCSTFFIDSESMMRRTKEEYIYIRERLRELAYDYKKRKVVWEYCSYLMEYSWHLLLADWVHTNKTKIPF